MDSLQQVHRDFPPDTEVSRVQQEFMELLREQDRVSFARQESAQHWDGRWATVLTRSGFKEQEFTKAVEAFDKQQEESKNGHKQSSSRG